MSSEALDQAVEGLFTSRKIVAGEDSREDVEPIRYADEHDFREDTLAFIPPLVSDLAVEVERASRALRAEELGRAHRSRFPAGRIRHRIEPDRHRSGRDFNQPVALVWFYLDVGGRDAIVQRPTLVVPMAVLGHRAIDGFPDLREVVRPCIEAVFVDAL